jgi:hypothetical protein
MVFLALPPNRLGKPDARLFALALWHIEPLLESQCISAEINAL